MAPNPEKTTTANQKTVTAKRVSRPSSKTAAKVVKPTYEVVERIVTVRGVEFLLVKGGFKTIATAQKHRNNEAEASRLAKEFLTFVVREEAVERDCSGGEVVEVTA